MLHEHEKHRLRVKKKFLQNGFPKATPQHEILELLLFYSIPRRDTNPLAHQLIKRFGSISAVFNAPISELVKIKGVTEHTATFIKLIPEISRIYSEDLNSTVSALNSVDEVGTYLLTRYAFFADEEVFSLLSMNNKGKLLSFDVIAKGDISSVSISVRKIIEISLNTKSTTAIIAHTHPGGLVTPSDSDLEITSQIKTALGQIGVNLIDHIILAGGDFISLADLGKI